MNGCTTIATGFGVSYLIWTIVDWYDAYHDYMFHIKDSATGMLIGLPCCLIAGVVAMVIG